MLTYRALVTCLRDLGLTPASRLIAHVDLHTLGPIAGGAEALLGAMLASCETLVMPAFTYRCMVTPKAGPPDNAIAYDIKDEASQASEVFSPEMPVDPSLGPLAEMLRQRPEARRSSHPVLSLVGVNAQAILEAQTLEEPLAPIGALADGDGDVLLLGADQRANFSLHYAERLAGRKQFLRWALLGARVVECPAFPGCAEGFEAVEPHIQGIIRQAPSGSSTARLIPLRDLVNITVGWIRQDPRALLCDRPECAACRDVRASVRMA